MTDSYLPQSRPRLPRQRGRALFGGFRSASRDPSPNRLAAHRARWHAPLVANPIEHVDVAELLSDAAPDAPGSPPSRPAGHLPADADAQVEAALFARAKGGTTWAEVLDRNGETVRLLRDLPADPKAALSWLQARKPQDWQVQAALMVEHRYVVELPAVARTTAEWLARVGRGEARQGAGDPDGSASVVPPASPEFQKNHPVTLENTAPQHDD